MNVSKIKHFLEFTTKKQLGFLEGKEFNRWERSAKIDFLKEILKSRLSSQAVAAAIKQLKELKYKDKYFYRRFLYHIDSSVCSAAREAIRQKVEVNDSDYAKLVRVLKEGDTADRILLANYFLEQEGKLDESTLISFLSVDDLKVRDAVVAGVSSAHQLDDVKLCRAVNSGVVWYVRAALVEILGKRKSKHLLDVIDELIQDRNVEVRLKLIGALSRMEQENARTHIRRLADDSVIWVRREAKRALETA